MVMGSLERLDPPRRLGKLTLLARLGEGGMASVFVASVGDGPLARLAAVKLLRAGVPDMDYKTRFEDEAKVVVRLHHNNIVDVREAGEVDGQLYIAMELIEGRDLSDVWDRCAEVGRAFPVPLAVYLVREILRGLHYAHTFPGLSLVHRDISPSNVLLDWAGAVRLADFGLATSVMKASKTMAGLVFGKVGYMAPEQAVRGELDGRADVYSCGVVLWELITGRPLRDGEIDTQGVAEYRARRPSTLSRRVDGLLDDIVMQSLSHDPSGRFSSAQAFMRALSGWLSEHAPQTTQESAAEFMGDLFGEARESDHAAYSRLLEGAPKTIAWERDARRRATREVRPTTEHDVIAPGEVLADRYKVERTLGQGGMGTVYLAEHMGVGRSVAVKVLTHDWSRHEVVARRFKEEARAANAAGHPNIVEVYDAGRIDDGRLYMAMELLRGRSLWEELVELGRFPIERACRIVASVADAIESAHRVGIVHRDLKPDNVMLVAEEDVAGDLDRVKVLDFGISASAVRSADEQRLTRPGHCVGTPEYMAPEQARGHDPAPAADIYALGVILYELISGSPPFDSENMVEVLTRKATEEAPSLAELRVGLPLSLVELCHACLEIEPERRPPTAGSVAASLDLIIAELGDDPFDGALAAAASGSAAMPAAIVASAAAAADQAFPISPAVEGTLEPTPVKSWWGTAAAAVAVATLLFGGLVWWQSPSSKPEPSATVERGGAVLAEVVPSPARGLVPKGATAAKETPAEAEPEAPIPAPTSSAEATKPARKPPAKRAPTPAPKPSTPAPSTASPEASSSVPVPVAQPPATKASTAASRAKSPECESVRDKASAAYTKRQYADALRLIGPAACWRGHRAAHDLLKVDSLFQTSKFDACAKAGASSQREKVKKIAAKCRAK